MAEQNIEAAITERLTGDTQKNALEFIAFMRGHGFSFHGFENGDDIWWTPAYKGEYIGTINVARAEKEFWLWLGLNCDFDGGAADVGLKEFTWSHVVNCPQGVCKPPYCERNSEHPGSRNQWKVFGREYESTCHAPLAFFNPDAEAFENIEKLMSMFKLK